jgi:hypothetical protein
VLRPAAGDIHLYLLHINKNDFNKINSRDNNNLYINYTPRPSSPPYHTSPISLSFFNAQISMS